MTTAAHASRTLTGRRVVLMFGLFVLLFFGLLVGFRQLVRQPPRPMPVLGQVPDLPLLERNDQRTTFGALKGKVLIVDLQLPECGAPCQDRNHEMGEIQRHNAAVARQVNQVTILQAPASLELVNLRARESAAHPEWRWFVAEPPHFSALQQQLLPTGEADLALVDSRGQVRRRYLTTRKEDRRELMLDIRALLLEQAGSTSATTTVR